MLLVTLVASVFGCSDASSPTRMRADNVRANATLAGSGSGLVAAYGFDEASGATTTDASGNNNTGTLGSGVARTTSGKFGGAMVFNGNYVTVPNAASLNLTTGMTVEAWVYPTAAATNYATAVMKEQPGDYVYALYNSAPGKPSAEIDVSTGNSGERMATGPSAVALNKWTHLASTFDGATLRLYVNGVQASSKAVTSPIITSKGALRIGGNAVWGEFFKGRIDEVRVYSRALSAGEIQRDMSTAVSEAPPPPPPADMTAPTVSITSPATGATYATTASSVTLSGSASDSVGVTQVTWTNSLGGSGTASGTTSWSATDVALQVGTNVLTVSAKDAANNVATTTLTVTMSAPTPAPTGLVAAYGFDEASGTTTADASGNTNTGTLGSGVVRTASGKYGSALVFNGNYVTVPSAASLNLTTAMTLEAWVYPTAAATNYATAVIKEQAGAYVYALYGSAPGNPSAELNVGTGQSGQRITPASSALPLNTWSHLTSTFDGTTERLYVNGTQVASNAVSGTITMSSGALRIGGNAVWGEFFRGQIDEVRIYNRALSGSEIQSDMNTAVSSTVTPPPPDVTPPTVSITSPATGATYTTTTSSVTPSGAASAGVKQVRWSNNRGGSGMATGTTSWSASGIALQSGSNVLTVTATDAENNAATATLTVTYNAPPPPPPATPTQLSITTQPGASAQSGVALAPQPSIQLRDASNAAVSQSGVVVTAALASGTGTLSGTLTATTNASGTATFSNLTLTGSGAQTLRFTATGLTAATSGTINVTAAAPPGSFATPNILNNASFESGWDGFTDWTGANAPQGVTRDNTKGIAGSTSILRSWTPSSSESGAQLLFHLGSADRVWVRFYFRLTAPITSIMKFARFYDTNFNTAMGGIFLQSGNDIFTWGTDQENSGITTEIGLSQNQIADSQWHWFEMEYWRNGDPSGTASAAFWLDGAQVSLPNGTKTKYGCPTQGACSMMYWSNGRLYSGVRTNSLKLGWMEWLATLNAGNTTAGQVNVDKLAISSAGRIGP